VIRIGVFAAAILAWLALGGCTSSSNGSAPELESDLTYDGLAKVKGSKAKAAWMRPDFSLNGYSKIMLIGAGIEYRPVKKVPRAGSSTASQFPLTEEQKERLRSVVSDAFKTALAQSQQFTIVDQPGPDTLAIWGGLVDVVSFVPPDAVGRSNIYLSSVGEATLVIEIRDSESNAVLVRIIDRKAAQNPRVVQRSTSVTNWSEVQQLARTWATQLRDGLDEATTWNK
jgi:hypothetical protein